ncbi:MAG: hypothetical protein D6775_02630, partial [Caldilineae bacterium]
THTPTATAVITGGALPPAAETPGVVAQVTITAAATVISAGTPLAGVSPTPFTPVPTSLTPTPEAGAGSAFLSRLLTPTVCLLVLVIIGILAAVGRLIYVLLSREQSVP